MSGFDFSSLLCAFGLVGAVAQQAQHAQNLSAPQTALLNVMMFGFGIFMPIIYGVMGFVFGVIMAAIYNLIAGWTGGIEVEVE
ncbi:MAG: hypothetical protein DME50_16860 [Verrucomicrobia bacterium]|nr:MAG: hypothetical protein DME50_16860 [Verrucomicrobiota bacterium]